MKIEVILNPAEFPALKQHDLHDATCVVFDILRATSSFVTALHNGANAIIPVSEISEAMVIRQRHPDVLLGGERDGVVIRAHLTGGIDFDLGNSPREYTPERVGGRTIVSTTTNGTLALQASAGARTVLASCFLNLTATANYLRQLSPARVVFVCAGTRENTALEDVLAAGALTAMFSGEKCEISDSATIAWRTYLQSKTNLPAIVRTSENARRLLGISELRDDVAFCLQQDVFRAIARMEADGAIRLSS